LNQIKNVIMLVFLEVSTHMENEHISHGYVATLDTSIVYKPRVGYSNIMEPKEDRLSDDV
jgi:hypothetical protein